LYWANHQFLVSLVRNASLQCEYFAAAGLSFSKDAELLVGARQRVCMPRLH
jgi:hypothetical protein